MLVPKKTKYRKEQKGRVAKMTTSGSTLNFGTHGLKAMEGDRITNNQIEAARRAAIRIVRSASGKLWTTVFPCLPVTKKPLEVRMGKGKGPLDTWRARVAPGRILFEVDGLPDDLAQLALRSAGAKLPVKTKIVKRYE